MELVFRKTEPSCKYFGLIKIKPNSLKKNQPEVDRISRFILLSDLNSVLLTLFGTTLYDYAFLLFIGQGKTSLPYEALYSDEKARYWSCPFR